jgi:hypothetical protein
MSDYVARLLQQVATDIIKERDALAADTYKYTPVERLRQCPKCDFTTYDLKVLVTHAAPRNHK